MAFDIIYPVFQVTVSLSKVNLFDKEKNQNEKKSSPYITVMSN